jgi:hypothetical protein
MGKKQATFTLDALINMVAAAKARNVTFNTLHLLPQQYQELRDDLYARLGLVLPTVDCDLPVIVGGIQLIVWKPTPRPIQ